MVVEDEAITAFGISELLRCLGYEVVFIAISGEIAIEKARELHPDLVLMDIKLAGKMDGIQVAEKIKEFADIPVVYLTAYADRETLGRAKITSPAGYVLKPVENKQLYVAIEMALHRQSIDLGLQKNHALIYESMKGMIKAVAGTIELRGPYAKGHHKRVARLSIAIAQEMGLTDFQVEGIELASLVYDVGLVNIPTDILQDIEHLEDLKLAMYQSYPEIAHEALKKIECVWPIADIVLQHRELLDGSGFPRGIKGEAILIQARILSVAVVTEDWMTRRMDRNAFPIDETLGMISAQRGAKYDSQVVDACLKLFNEKGFKREA